MNKKNLTSNIVAQNRKASFNYFFEDTLEAGIELLGSEVKSLRSGKGSIADSYALDSQGEIYLHNTYIPEYKQGSYNRNHRVLTNILVSDGKTSEVTLLFIRHLRLLYLLLIGCAYQKNTWTYLTINSLTNGISGFRSQRCQINVAKKH